MSILNNLFAPLSNPLDFPIDTDEVPAPGFDLWATNTPNQAVVNENGQFIQFKLTS